jgi:hypothetical protein
VSLYSVFLSLRAQIETRFPSAFATYKRPERRTILTGIPQVDAMTGGVPLKTQSVG